MTPQQARDAIEETLRKVAPDADLATVPPGADLRDALGLDSLDFLALVEELSQRAGQRIEEDDYPRLATLDGGIAFLSAA